MNRRGFLMISGSVITLASGCVSEISGNQNLKPYREFSSYGFEKVEWTEDNKLAVTVSEEHDMDAFGIRYHTKSKPKDDIANAKPPEYGGTVNLDFFGNLISEGLHPPAGRYNIYAYKGQDVAIALVVEEVIGKVSFQIQPTLKVSTTSLIDNKHVSFQVENNGNAPVFVLDARTSEGRGAINNFIGFDSTALVRTSGTPFKTDDNCVIVPSETDISLSTIPRVEASAHLDTEYDEPERVCEISM